MKLLLENENLRVEIKEKGAELCNLYNKETGIEHMWQADEKVWGKHAPILFPIVGQLTNGECLIDEKRYELSRHGFARDLDFSVVSKDSNKITFELQHTESTLKVYPFKFVLQVCYTLTENNLKVEFLVKNVDNKNIQFSIGGHPAFATPFNENEELTDYYLDFNKDETVKRIALSTAGYLANEEKEAYFDKNNKISLTKSTFEDDALVFAELNSNKITIKSEKNKHSLEFKFENYSFFGIWSKPGANFVCLEPWHGVTDRNGWIGEFKDKLGIIELDIDKSFICNYEIKVK